MTNKELRGYIQHLYKYKRISNEKFRKAVNNLEILRDADPHFYYFNMGKLHSLFGNPNEALTYLEKALEIKPGNPTCYYNMYKCHIKNGDFDKAYEVLNEVIYYNEKEVDFSLHLALLQTIKLIDTDFESYLKNDISVQTSIKCGLNDLCYYPELARIYDEVIAAYNNRDYKGALNKLQGMDYIIRESNYPMEVDTLITLVKAVKEKNINHYINDINDETLKNCDHITYSNYYLRLYELGKYNQESFFKRIQEIIDDGKYSSANYLLDVISESKDFEKHLDIVEYLRGLVREKRAFATLSEEEQNDFTAKRLRAKRKYTKKQHEACLEAYTELKEEYNLLICDYYIAKVMLRMGMFAQAKEKFLNYLQQGGAKAKTTYMFLSEIEKNQNNIPEAKRYARMYYKIKNVFSKDFKSLSDKQYNNKKIPKPEDNKFDEDYEVKNKNRMKPRDNLFDEDDEVKKKVSRNIRMTEEDFIKPTETDVLDFYDASVDRKLSIIKDLLQNGHESVANKLLEEMQKECLPEERGKVMQFSKNKKLYKNQNRTSSSK